ncbi:hypothetical protein N7508_008175 [Penicillium antarcticum]|uniref:uncharacterized protein n=1 Tax=Penicillium antarcticum TaxID=416450 RepID=UPI0023A220D9|nr:uncharacterized protein N7508_008175 [Penicillium antarcticum]KAJ5297926.1 hypothetical protein N7508_008175 [Penicillium antarcticum]
MGLIYLLLHTGHDGPFQLSIAAAGNFAHNLHEQLCALDHARNYGPESEWVGGHFEAATGNDKLATTDANESTESSGYSGNVLVSEKD